MSVGNLGPQGQLKARHLDETGRYKARGIRLPFGLGRLIHTHDPGSATRLAREYFQTHLHALHLDGDGQVKGEHHLGSGLVTNVGVLAMANDFAWSASLNLATLALSNQHASGTGATAAATTDIAIQTLSTQGGQNAVAGTQSLVTAANLQKYKTVATINYTGTEAVTEWGLFTLATLSSTTGTPFTATTATSWQDTGSAQTASSATVRGLQQTIVVPGTTTVWGLNLSNTTHVGTIPAWYKVADGTAGSTPGATEAFTVKPVMWDHKQFAAINVVSGDSVQFTYNLTVNSGG